VRRTGPQRERESACAGRVEAGASRKCVDRWSAAQHHGRHAAVTSEVRRGRRRVRVTPRRPPPCRSKCAPSDRCGPHPTGSEAMHRVTPPARALESTEAMSELRRTALPVARAGSGTDRVALWVVDDLGLPAVRTPKAPVRERIHVPLPERDRRRMFEGDEHLHGPSSGRGRHATRPGRVRARRERHLGTGTRYAVLRARLRGRGRRQL
jgi:hypothetical protein